MNNEPKAVAFTLDTSGVVVSRIHPSRTWEWSDLDPFTQGYVEALFAGGLQHPVSGARIGAAGCGFSDLAPETLAAILKDCARFAELYGEWPLSAHGAGFWIGRQKRKHKYHLFPPLTPYLGDDGKVYLREAVQ